MPKVAPQQPCASSSEPLLKGSRSFSRPPYETSLHAGPEEPSFEHLSTEAAQHTGTTLDKVQHVQGAARHPLPQAPEPEMIYSRRLSSFAPIHLHHAAVAYEDRHHRFSARATYMQKKVDSDPAKNGGAGASEAFRKAAAEVQRDRFPHGLLQPDELNKNAVITAEHMLSLKHRPWRGVVRPVEPPPPILKPVSKRASQCQASGPQTQGVAAGGASSGSRPSKRTLAVEKGKKAGPMAPILKKREPIQPVDGAPTETTQLPRPLPPPPQQVRTAPGPVPLAAPLVPVPLEASPPAALAAAAAPPPASPAIVAQVVEATPAVVQAATAVGAKPTPIRAPSEPQKLAQATRSATAPPPAADSKVAPSSPKVVQKVPPAQEAPPAPGVVAPEPTPQATAEIIVMDDVVEVGKAKAKAATERSTDVAPAVTEVAPPPERRAVAQDEPAPRLVVLEQQQVEDPLQDEEEAFDPLSTIWAPRANWCDAKNLFDTQAVQAKRFECEWKRTIALGMAREIERNSKKGADGASDELVEVAEILGSYFDSLILVFAYYATYSNELHYLTLNAWTQWTEDFKLVKNSSKFLKKADMDRLFIAVDTMSVVAEREQQRAAKASVGSQNVKQVESDRQKAMSMTEFTIAIVYLSMYKYVKTGEVPDVSDALEKFLSNDIASRVHPRLMAPTNEFRRKYAYSMDVCYVLQWHETSLRHLFALFAQASHGATSTLVSLDAWRNGISALGLISADLAERDVCLCFSWSRMCVADHHTKLGAKKDSNLPFEGFIEAICRMAMLKALPTDDEIVDAECEDASSYLAQLQLFDTPAYEKLLERKNPWGAEPSQPAHRCVAHMMAVILRRIKVMGEDDDGAEIDQSLTEDEVRRWYKKNGGMMRAKKT